MQTRGEFPGIATVDCCLNLVFCFGVLLQLAIVSINPVTIPGAAHQNSLALYLIKVSWPGDCHDDVDTYVQDPQGHLVYFRALNDGAMTLEHDDTGYDAITQTGSDGVTQYLTDNQERVDIRAIAPGEYTVNVHMYRKDKQAPTTVLVTLYKVTD